MSLTEKFSKKERLCSRKLIEELFENGEHFYTPHFRVVWKTTDQKQESPAMVAISVTKRGFKLAVVRNLLKRRIREAYRKKKSQLYGFLTEKGINICFIMIYRSDKISDYIAIESAVHDVIQKLIFATQSGKNSK
jgi:ribonuclease P protein component